LGVARNLKFTENIETSKIQTDNGPDISNAIGDHTVMISGTLLEMYPLSLQAIRGGIDSRSVTTADATTDTDVYTTGQWGKGDIIWLQNQGATDTLAAISKVKSVSTGNACTTYTATDDYTVVTDSKDNYKRGVVLNAAGAGGDYNDTEALKIKYVYGAIGSEKWTSGGLDTISTKYHRFINARVIDGTVKYIYWVVYSGSINKGLDLAFKSANEADSVLEMPFEIMARLDTSRTVGDQLFYIENEQTVA